MVGHPKSLTDLRKIEAAVRVTCPACKHVVVRDREELISHLTYHRKNLDWRMLPHQLACEKCCHRPVDILALPFTAAAGRAEVGTDEAMRLNLALKVLNEASHRSLSGAVGTTEVRLALRVLAPYVRDQNLLREYWRGATEEPRTAWTSCQLPYRWITTKLCERGYPIWAELRV